MVQGQVFLKGTGEGGGEGTGTFPIYFFEGSSFLHLEITSLFSKLCHAFEEKLFFSAKKVSKNDPEYIPLIKITYLQRNLQD